MNIYTIGHSAHSQDEFITLLNAHHIETLVDVRSYPGSRHVPQFNKENMEKWLPNNNIEYLHMPELGGRRRKVASIDELLIDGWTHISFRNYAAYTLTGEYERGIEKLLEIANKNKTCYFCSECVPWRCHRSLVSNTLTARGDDVWHIMSVAKLKKHELGEYGAVPVVDGDRIIYPKDGQLEMHCIKIII